MKLVGYIRVSTNGQVEDGAGLQIQESSVRTWAKTNGHTLEEIYRDEGVSGSENERDGLAEALTAIKFNGADGLVVPSLDRLAPSLTVQEAALQQIWRADGAVFTVETGLVPADDPDDPVRTFVRQVLGAVSQLEAGIIRRRLLRGRRHKASTGGYTHGAPPFGWRAEGGELVPDPAEQEVVRMMRSSRERGDSLRSIAKQLNAERISPKRGETWYPQTVARVLQRSDPDFS